MMKMKILLIFLSILISFSGCLERPDRLLFKKGQLAEEEKRYIQAEEFYQKALAETDNSELRLTLYRRLAEVYKAKNQNKERNRFLNLIVLNSNDRRQRLDTKQELAESEFFKT